MNDKQLDETFQKKVTHVQKHNGIHVFWDKEGVWKRIQKALEETGGPKMIAWYTVMAASVSLLAASAVNIIDYDLDFFDTEEKEVVEAVNQSVNMENTSQEVTHFVSLPADSKTIPVRSRQVPSINKGNTVVILDRLPESKVSVQNLSQYSFKDLSKPQFNSKVKFHVAAGVSANKKYIFPKVDLGLMVNLSKTKGIQKNLFVGSSIQFLKNVNPEQGLSNQLSKNYFLKTAYENERIDNGKRKSWSTGAEFLIHSDDDSLPGNTLKVFYNRSVIGRLKVGPEVMFTRSFKKVYPGITLALG